MSRIIKNIIQSVWPIDNPEYIVFSNNKEDLDLVKSIGGNPISFERNPADLNNIIRIISDVELSNNLLIRPTFVLNIEFLKYHNAKNLGDVLKIPIINYISNVSNVKKESIFSMAVELENDINIVSNIDIAKELYLTKYHITNDIPELIKSEIKKWKSM